MSITSTVEICIQQLGRVEEIVWLPYDACLSAAAETLVGILKRVIDTLAVYPCFFNFFTLTFRALGAHCHESRPWSRQPNDVMFEIVCAQLHNELLGHRHNTLQLHSLCALAKHLYTFVVNKLKCCNVTEVCFISVCWEHYRYLSLYTCSVAELYFNVQTALTIIPNGVS